MAKQGSVEGRSGGAGGRNRRPQEQQGLKEAVKLVKGCDPKLVEMIMNEVVAKGATGVKFEDISGLDKAKAALQVKANTSYKYKCIFRRW